MEFFGVFAFIMVLYCTSKLGDLEKLKRLVRKLKLVERNMKGESIMSKLISDLKGERCLIRREEVIYGKDSINVECEILDVDDEWIKIRFKDKKDNMTTQIIRIDILKSIELIGVV